MQWLVDNNFSITEPEDDLRHLIKQQDNPLFRLIRIITHDKRRYNPYVIFVSSEGSCKSEENIRHLVYEGIAVNGQRYVFSERSASMTRTGIFSFVDARIADELNRRITMDITFDTTVLSKYYAYRGLFFSSCHCLEGWRPKIIIVPDLTLPVPHQHIKYLYDSEVSFVDKNGNERTWKQKDIAETTRDMEINAFDGCGIHHPDITKEVTEILGAKSPVTSILWRAPYIKGVSHSVDYETFFEARGVEYIKDIWGRWHSIHDKMLIFTESMYKGLKYFKQYGDGRDWDRYWDLFEKYDHCIGIAKWNFSFAEEPVFTRANYQILQDLDLPYDDFRSLADDSIEWAERIVGGDMLYTYCFLGLMADRCTPINAYSKAILKNPEMMKERTVRKFLRDSAKKYIDGMKCGKLWLESCFKFLAPDLILLMEHIGGLPLVGSLQADEFYSRDYDGVYTGDYLIERNPHICRSEHTVLRAVTNDTIDYYIGHLANVCMVNCRSLTAPRLNGADFDGDLVLVLQNFTMMRGVHRDAPIVIDVEDKITAKMEPDNSEGRLALTMRTMKSLIGEYSNYSSAYHNKCPKTDEQRAIYEGYIDQISVLTGKAIDQAKTGVIFPMPRRIAKFGRPLPYFMKYRKPYYAKQKLSKAHSNMNRLCYEVERWHKQIRWQRCKKFDYTIMLDNTIDVPDDIFSVIRDIYKQYTVEMNSLMLEQKRVRAYQDEDIKVQLSRFNAKNYVIDWDVYYDKYRQLCREVCPDAKMLANIAVRLQYEVYPKSESRFMWVVAEKGILENICQVEHLKLPQRDPFGEYCYLGRRYSMVEVQTTPPCECDDFNDWIGEWQFD